MRSRDSFRVSPSRQRGSCVGAREAKPERERVLRPSGCRVAQGTTREPEWRFRDQHALGIIVTVEFTCQFAQVKGHLVRRQFICGGLQRLGKFAQPLQQRKFARTGQRCQVDGKIRDVVPKGLQANAEKRNKKEEEESKVSFIKPSSKFHRPPNDFQDFDPKQIEDLRLKFEQAGLSEHWELCKPYLKNEILFDIVPAEEKDFTLGESKIGGKPNLPHGIEWFKDNKGNYLDFLAQINMEEVAPYDIEKLLPTKGMLYFFYDEEQESWGRESEDKDKFKVFFFDDDLKQLVVREHPNKLKVNPYFKQCKLSFKKFLSFPEDLLENLDLDLKSDSLFEFYDTLHRNYGEQHPDLTKLVGYPNVIQNPMEEECVKALDDYDTFSSIDRKLRDINQNPYEWTLLFQLNSIDEAEMMWGDCGNLYFWIKMQDLKAKKFENCWQILQCY